MKNKPVPTFAIAAVALTLLIGMTLLAQQDRYTLKVPDGLAFSEFKGYDTWQTIAVMWHIIENCLSTFRPAERMPMAAVRALIGSFFCLSGGTNLFVPAKFSTSAEQVAA